MLKKIIRKVEFGRPRPDTPFDALLRSNSPPSDAQRAEIEVKMRELHAQFRDISGVPYSDHLNRPRGISARSLKRCYDNIRSHEGLLSLVRFIPVEILQRIFFLVTLTFSTGKNGWLYVDHNRKGLSVLCGVCRCWRAAALDHCVLWTKLPRIDSGRYRNPAKGAIDDEMRQLYISQSGCLPLTIDLSATAYDWDTGPSTSTKDVAFVLGQCRRLEILRIATPQRLIEPMFRSLRGNIPLLRRLEIMFEDDGPNFRGLPPPIECFSEAPALSEVTLAAYEYGYRIRDGLRITLPWFELPDMRMADWEAGSTFMFSLTPEICSKVVVHHTSGMP